MKVSEVEDDSSFRKKVNRYVDRTIKNLVREIRKNIRNFGNAKIEGQHEVLNVRGKMVERRLGIDLNFLSRQAENHAIRGWIEKHGDVYTIGYK